MIDIEQLNQKLKELEKQTRYHIDRQEYQQAKQTILQVLEYVPHHPIAYTDLALMEIRMGNPEEAYRIAHLALKHADINGAHREALIYDMLVQTCWVTKRFEEGRYYGRRAIEQRLTTVAEIGSPPMPIHFPAPPLSSNPTENIISFSLFGDLPRYCEIAVINARLTKQIYPEWTCRFYVDNTVPQHIITRLMQHEAQIIDMTGDDLNGLFWRFLVAEDPHVKRFIVRDADSLLNHKERAAVDEWLLSGKHFHIMRDSLEHTELILAGMWGGCGGILTHLRHHIINSTFRIKNKTIDQQFLRNAIWNTVAQSVLTHDTFALDKNSRPFPVDYPIGETERLPYFHIGMIDAAYDVNIHIDDPKAQRVCWYLFDEHKQIICHYEADVPTDHIVKVKLPMQYNQKIKEGQWKIFTQTL